MSRGHTPDLLSDLRWTAHDKTHDAERNAVDAALVAHRREHAIAEVAQDKADAAHQLRHEQMNEIRQQLNDQATTFVRSDVLNSVVANIERRLTEQQRETLSYRDALSAEIADLREYKSGGERVSGLLPIGISLLAVVITVILFVLAYKH